MKPTQEQAIAWAREAGYGDALSMLHSKALSRFAALAYEAGRKDENEALRARLAQPEQDDEKGKPMTYWGGLAQPEPAPRRKWQGLTDEEVFAALVAVDGNTKRLAPGFVAFYCAIEAALKAKNG